MSISLRMEPVFATGVSPAFAISCLARREVVTERTRLSSNHFLSSGSIISGDFILLSPKEGFPFSYDQFYGFNPSESEIWLNGECTFARGAIFGPQSANPTVK